MNERFGLFREKYPRFFYNGFSLKGDGEAIRITYDFSIEGLCGFHPEIVIPVSKKDCVNPFDGDTGRLLVFSLGLVELISYWKCVCPPQVVIRCGSLSPEQILRWKKLWWGGLGEFFYRNAVDTDFESFLNVSCEGGELLPSGGFVSSGELLVPVGGGKDSAVTLSLLAEKKDKIRCFTVNSQKARTDTVLAAGLSESSILNVTRTISPELLRLNAEGCLNGHTPFSAIVAFLGLYCAYLIGAQNVVLSNESSADEATVPGSGVNHQYSKSTDFERTFSDYVQTFFDLPIKYFSLLRPFNELQIAAYFASKGSFHAVFRSCNAGSKKNIWCCKCAKCLFVRCILAPFIPPEKLREIFGAELFDDEALLGYLDSLTGLSASKPFECIGTVEEVNAALSAACKKYYPDGKYPLLLRRFLENGTAGDADIIRLLREFNTDNLVPQEFMPAVKEMYGYASTAY